MTASAKLPTSDFIGPLYGDEDQLAGDGGISRRTRQQVSAVACA